MVAVALYTNEPVLAAGFSLILSPEKDLSLAATVRDVSACATTAQTDCPDVFLLDVTPALTLRTLMQIRQAAPTVKIVLWAQSVSLEFAHQAKEAGIRGVLRKDSSTELTLRCLRKVAVGELWFERDLMNSLLEVKSVRLSPREQQLVDLVSRGYSNKQIAYELTISEGTVKVYFSKLFRKVGVSDRFELALHGLKQGRGENGVSGGAASRSLLIHHAHSAG